jgi:hypothetical protein
MGLLPGLVQVPFEGVEPLAPEPPVGLQPLVELVQRLRAQGVQASLAIDPGPDEPGLPQHPKVLRDARLAEAEPEHELVHRPLALPQEARMCRRCGSAITWKADMHPTIELVGYMSIG